MERRTLRYLGAALAGLVAVVYGLIAAGVITDVAADDAPAAIPLALAIVYAIGAILLVNFDRRIVWVLGAVLQVFVIIGYFAVAGGRDPHFEAWGLGLKVVDATLLALLGYLSMKHGEAAPRPAQLRSAT